MAVREVRVRAGLDQLGLLQKAAKLGPEVER